jgi:hypothetical protein
MYNRRVIYQRLLGAIKMSYKCKEGMIDNRMVKDDHQQGIERVKQRPGSMVKGQGGKMGEKIPSENNWKRSGESMTPRKA